jgi:hypothetical protein
MKVEQKSYAQILIVNKNDFIFSSHYKQYAEICPFMCFPAICASSFRVILKNPQEVLPDKDVILMLESYWIHLSSEEKKAILDHELGHISNGDLEDVTKKLKAGQKANEVDFDQERKADHYSVQLNGRKAMHNAMHRALEEMLAPLRAKGSRATVADILASDEIIRKRMAILAKEPEAE